MAWSDLLAGPVVRATVVPAVLVTLDVVDGFVSFDIDGFRTTFDVDVVVDELDNESVDERRDVVAAADVGADVDVDDAFWKVLRNDDAEFSSADFFPKLLGGDFFFGSSGRTPIPDSRDEWLFSSLPLPQLLLLLQLLKYPVDAEVGLLPADVSIRITDGD